MNTAKQIAVESSDLELHQESLCADSRRAPRATRTGKESWFRSWMLGLSIGLGCTPSETRRTINQGPPVAAVPVQSSDAGHNRFDGALWSYVGLSGPKHWSEVSAKFSLCGQGAEQSPVNIETDKGELNHDLQASYKDTPLHLVDNGHTVQEEVEPGSRILVGGRESELVQFHYHTPSENHLDGKEYPLELHFVHKGGNGELSVIAVMVEPGKANAEVDHLVGFLPHSNEEVREPRTTLHPYALLPKSLDYYGFQGSLTTPPCTEGVRWMVLKATISMSPRQIASFEHLHGANARPVQRHHVPPAR